MKNSEKTAAVLISFKDLKSWTGFKKPKAVKKWLEENDIPFFFNKAGEPVTTYTAVDAALAGKRKSGTTATLEMLRRNAPRPTRNPDSS